MGSSKSDTKVLSDPRLFSGIDCSLICTNISTRVWSLNSKDMIGIKACTLWQYRISSPKSLRICFSSRLVTWAWNAGRSYRSWRRVWSRLVFVLILLHSDKIKTVSRSSPSKPWMKTMRKYCTPPFPGSIPNGNFHKEAGRLWIGEASPHWRSGQMIAINGRICPASVRRSFYSGRDSFDERILPT